MRGRCDRLACRRDACNSDCYVYRGSTYPALVGQYVLADFCSGRFYTMPAAGSSLWMRRDTTLMVTSFGESESGELYAVTINGRLYQIGTK